MAKRFGHEKLRVYQKAMDFVVLRSELLGSLSRKVAACNHLERAAESVVVNIAHASNSWSAKERVVSLGNANGSALECTACLDVFVAKALLSSGEVDPGKSLLAEVVRMLVGMWKETTGRVREDSPPYSTRKGRLFSHEGLHVYQEALSLVAWLDGVLGGLSCSADLRSKLDKATTAIALNIAEGNGRFSGADQAKFLRIAFRATVQSASLVDLATINSNANPAHIETGRDSLRQIAAMLSSLAKSASNNT